MKPLIPSLTTLAVAACLAAPAFAGTVISVDLWDAGETMVMVDNMRIMNHADMMHAPMAIKISQDTAPAGEITFNAVNSSKSIEHEMVIATLTDPTAGLVYKQNSGRVDENAPGMNLGEIAELEPGEKGSLTVTLAPGTYALYCNLAGHYASGMWTILTVE